MGTGMNPHNFKELNWNCKDFNLIYNINQEHPINQSICPDPYDLSKTELKEINNIWRTIWRTIYMLTASKNKENAIF